MNWPRVLYTFALCFICTTYFSGMEFIIAACFTIWLHYKYGAFSGPLMARLRSHHVARVPIRPYTIYNCMSFLLILWPYPIVSFTESVPCWNGVEILQRCAHFCMHASLAFITNFISLSFQTFFLFINNDEFIPCTPINLYDGSPESVHTIIFLSMHRIDFQRLLDLGWCLYFHRIHQTVYDFPNFMNRRTSTLIFDTLWKYVLIQINKNYFEWNEGKLDLVSIAAVTIQAADEE